MSSNTRYSLANEKRPSPTETIGYRVRCSKTHSGWAWDVKRLRFFGKNGKATFPLRPIESGNAGKGYEAAGAILEGKAGMWGGRSDCKGQFWIGGEFPIGTEISRYELEEVQDDPHNSVAGSTLLERRDTASPNSTDGASWVPHHTATVRADTSSGWAWDICDLRFFSTKSSSNMSGGGGVQRVYPLKPIESGSAGPGYSAEGALSMGSGQLWGGRKDPNNGGDIWIGGKFPVGTIISHVELKEHASHRAEAGSLSLECLNENGRWIAVKDDDGADGVKGGEEDGDEREGKETPFSFSFAGGREKKKRVKKVVFELPVPKDEELLSKPSRHLNGRVHSVCYKFYHAECCEGLWVCVSHRCGKDILAKACALVRRTIPEKQRSLWGAFRSPKWAKDPGPMRIVVLDNRTNEEAGCIPELQDGSRGRNGTSCPFVFTSREDFEEGVGGGSWKPFQLTVHEMTHGADMVIRQLIDPYFHYQVALLWEKHADKFLIQRQKQETYRWTAILANGRQVLREEQAPERYCYAAANRDEYPRNPLRGRGRGGGGEQRGRRRVTLLSANK
eukprot:jgi/Bigna1/139624/aug1.51_g14332